jgi:hypothetical protein
VLANKAAVYAREKWEAFERWRQGTEQSAAGRQPTRASLLLAMACYTRGLWRPLFMWRILFPGPYRCRSIAWRMDDHFVKLHLILATVYAIPWTIAEFMLLFIFWFSGDFLTGSLFVMLVLVQWLVFPWFVGRRLWTTHGQKCLANCEIPSPPVQLVVAKENGGQIGDLGFLLREANFSVDSEHRLPHAAPTPDAGPPAPAKFFERLEQAFAGSRDVVTQRIEVHGSEQVQPGSRHWPHWDSPLANPTLVEETDGRQRLLIFGQHPQVDGLTTVELDVQQVKTHLSFTVRLRWLPPLTRRIERLHLLVMQLPWLRVLVLPVVLLFAVFLQSYPAGWLREGFRPELVEMKSGIEAAQRDLPRREAKRRLENEAEHKQLILIEGEMQQLQLTFTQLTPAERERLQPEFVAKASRLEERHQELLPKVERLAEKHEAATKNFRAPWSTRMFESAVLALLERAQRPSAMVVAVSLTAVIVLLPLPLFMLLVIWRLLRWGWGYVAAAGRCHINVVAPPNLRFSFATANITDADPFRWCTAYLQIIEEVLTNRLIEVLQEHAIDTSSIRQEMSVFVNEGIYMTGGNLQAENVLVGRRAVLKGLFGGRQAARSGQVALLRRNRSH